MQKEVISVRINPELKNKIMNEYGGAHILESLIEEHFQTEEEEHLLNHNNQRLKELEKAEKLFERALNKIKKQKKIINNIENAKNESDKNRCEKSLKSLDNELDTLERDFSKELDSLSQKKKVVVEENKSILDTIKEYCIEKKPKITNTIQKVKQKLAINFSSRQERPTPPIPRSEIENYARECNMRYSRFIQFIPQDFHTCISES